jgi:hypothetical protein
MERMLGSDVGFGSMARIFRGDIVEIRGRHEVPK